MGYTRGLFENRSIYISCSGTNSVQMLASVAGAKWNLGAGILNWQDATVSLTVLFKEVGNDASNDVFSFLASASSGQWGFTFLPLGVRASDTNTALKLETSDQGSITGWFTGFYD